MPKIDKELYKCQRLLSLNGWEHSGDAVWVKDGVVAVQICVDELVFLDDSGDFLHIPFDYYTLVGALLEHRQIAADYKSGRC